MSHLNLPLPSSFLPFLLPFLLLGPGWDMFWTPLGIVGTSLGPDLGFGVVYLRILWDLFGISVGHVGTCWDMLGHVWGFFGSRSEKLEKTPSFPIPHSGDSGTDTHFVVFCLTGTQSWLGAILCHSILSTKIHLLVIACSELGASTVICRRYTTELELLRAIL